LILNETEASGRKDLPDLSLKISMAKKNGEITGVLSFIAAKNAEEIKINIEFIKKFNFNYLLFRYRHY
jgi:hypothetical protein